METAVPHKVPEQILSYLSEHREEMVAFLEALVRAESPAAVPASQEAVQRLLREALVGVGFAVRHLPGHGRSGGHLYARPRVRRRGRPVQLLLGHSDTVWPVGTLQEMPFGVQGEVVRGPGVYDMKGGLVQLIYALKALHVLGLDPPAVPVAFINSDEEVGSRESASYIRLLARRACRVFVLEPALGLSGRLKAARKGAGRFVVRIRGRSAHAGLAPEAGASAIVELSYVIQQLHALNDPEQGITVNVGMIDGGTQPNVVAPVSKAVVDVRVPTFEAAARVEAAIRALTPTTPGTELEVEGGIGRLPMERTPRNRALWHLARRAGRALGLELEEGLAGGCSDGNTTSQYTATLDGLGAVGDGAHAQHEFLYLDKMPERCALLAVLLLAPPTRRPPQAVEDGSGNRRRRTYL